MSLLMSSLDLAVVHKQISTVVSVFALLSSDSNVRNKLNNGGSITGGTGIRGSPW